MQEFNEGDEIGVASTDVGQEIDETHSEGAPEVHPERQNFIHEEAEREKILHGSSEGLIPIPAGYERGDGVPKDIARLIGEIRPTGLSDKQTRRLHAVLRRYIGVFSTGPGDYGKTPLMTFQIDTGEHDPIAARYRPIPAAYEKEVRANIDEMLRNGIIEKCDSPWNSTLVLVRKPDGRIRMCVNLKNVNSVTVNRTSFPINQQEQSFAKIGRGKYYFRLDLSQAYYSIPLDAEGDRNKTAFSVFGSQYRFRVSPFGAKFLPSKFNQLMTMIFEGLDDFLFYYFDDVIGVFQTFDELIEGLTKVLFRLIQANMRVNLQKSDFCLTALDKLKWLGTIIHHNKIIPDPEKTRAITEIPVPKDKKAMMRFLGMVGYHRRHLPRLAQVAEPLYKVIGATATYKITDKEMQAFNEVKRLITSAEALALPDVERPFIVTCDASDVAVGGILTQKNPDQPDGPENVIAYCSRTFTENEQHCSSCEKELLAILYSLSVFYYYVANTHFTLRSDSKSLVYLRQFRDNGKLFRASMFLDELDFDIQHMSARKGNLMMVADIISRATQGGQGEAKKKPTYKDLRNPVYNELTHPPGMPDGPVSKAQFIQAADRYLEWFRCRNAQRIKENPYKVKRQLGVRDGEVAGHPIPPRGDGVEELGHFLEAINKKNEKETNGNGGTRPILTVTLRPQFVTRREFIEAQKADPDCMALCKKLKAKGEEGTYKMQWGMIVRKRKLANGIRRYVPFAPTSLRSAIVEHLHGMGVGPHVGRKRLTLLVQTHFYWPDIDKTVQEICRGCRECQYQQPNTDPQVVLKRVQQATRPNEVVSWDIVGPYPPAFDGERYLLTLQCEYSKFTLAFPLRTKQPEGLLRAFITGWVAPFGAPKFLRSDEGTDTDSALAQYVCHSLNITKITTPIYSPQANPIERWHRTLNQALRTALTQADKRYWATIAPMIAMQYNQSVHTVTKLKPAELFLGRDTAQALVPVIPEEHPALDRHRYLRELQRAQRIFWAINQRRIAQATGRAGQHPAGEPVYKVGDYVLVRNFTPKHKLDDAWVGPFRIVEARPNAFTVVQWNMTIDVPVVIRYRHQPREMGEIIKRKVHPKDLKPFRAEPILREPDVAVDKTADELLRRIVQQANSSEGNSSGRVPAAHSGTSRATTSSSSAPVMTSRGSSSEEDANGGAPPPEEEEIDWWADFGNDDDLAGLWAEETQPVDETQILGEDAPEEGVMQEPGEGAEGGRPLSRLEYELEKGELSQTDPEVRRVLSESVLPFMQRLGVDEERVPPGQHPDGGDTDTVKAVKHLAEKLTMGSLADLKRGQRLWDRYEQSVREYETERREAKGDKPPTPPELMDFWDIPGTRTTTPVRAASAASKALVHWQGRVPKEVHVGERALSEYEERKREWRIGQAIREGRVTVPRILRPEFVEQKRSDEPETQTGIPMPEPETRPPTERMGLSPPLPGTPETEEEQMTRRSQKTKRTP